MDNLIAAHNQLVLSPYFQQYLGSDKVKSSKEEWQSAFYFELLEVRKNGQVHAIQVKSQHWFVALRLPA